MSRVSPPHVVSAGSGPNDETMWTRIVVIDLACPGGSHVIGRSSVDANHGNTVDSVSREHARPGVRAANWRPRVSVALATRPRTRKI